MSKLKIRIKDKYREVLSFEQKVLKAFGRKTRFPLKALKSRWIKPGVYQFPYKGIVC